MHFDEGDVYEAMTEDGQRYTITVGARNEDGTVQVQSSLDAEPVNVNPEQVGGAILADMDRARASQGEAEQGEIDGQAEMPSADVDTAQSNVPVYQQSDVVEARMPGGTVRGEIFEVSEEAGMPVYSVQWESPVQGVMVGRYSGEELSALQPAAEPEIGIELVMPTDEEVAAVTAERLRREEAEAANGNNLIPEDLRRVLSSEEIEALMDAMEENAVEPENVPYTREEWDARFSSPIETPAGKVRMGEHQFGKLHPDGNEQRQDRRGWIGHIYATLTSPSIIVEQPSPETGAEREYKYVFVKSFVNADGDAVTFFASVTVKKNDMEVVITNHFKKYKDVKNLLKKGKLCFSSVSPSGMQTEPNRSTASATTSEADINAGASASKGTTQSVSVQENEQKSLQPLPTRTTKKGTEVLYHEVPVARTLEELYDGTLTQPEVDAFVTANVKESRKAAERIESTPPKMGTDLAAYKQAKAEWQGKVDEARRKADYWLEVQAEVQKITGRQNESASRSIESASRSIESASRFTEMPTSMSEAQDGAEYAAMAFAGKMALRITPESFRGETGLGSAEQRQLTGVIATPENGGVTIEQAAEWLYAAQENDGVSFYADETEARDAIIEVLSQGNPKGYVARSRKEAAKRDSQAEAADKEAWAQQHFHMSFEEYQAMEEQALPAIIEQYRGFDEATYYANLANDYEQQNERRNDTEKDSATESAGIGRSGELLQGEQPASTGGTRYIGDGQQGRAAASDVQGGVSAEDARGASGEGRSENNRNLAERQGDLGTSIKTSATETDEDGSPFVLSSSGTTTFGEIKAETGLTPAPIKLSLGNSKYGLIHLERRHGEQIRNAGFKSVEEFVEYVCKNYKRIKQGENSVGEENGTYLLQIEDAHNNTLYIELSTDGRYWGVNSGGVFRKGYGNNKKEVWSASEEQNKQSVADSTLREEENPDIPTTPNGDVPTTSTGKSTEEVSNLQGNGQESAADAEDAPVKAETPTISQESEQVSDQDNAPYNAEEARRQPLRERAKEWEAKTGVKVHLIEDLSEVQNKAARAALEAGEEITGWYGRRTGEVYIYLPNVQNESDIDATYVHEVVAHKGMRSLLSAEGYDKLCDRVWNAMSEDARREYTNYPGVENIADEAKRRRAAADEYIAHLAEKVNLTDAEQTVWQQVVQFFREALEALGIDVKVSDAQLSELIRASYAKMAQERKMETETETETYERLLGEMRARQAELYERLPRPGHLTRAYRDGDNAAIEQWEDKWRQSLQEMTPQDLYIMGATARGMSGAKKDILKLNDKGRYVIDNERAEYKAYDYIEKSLKRRIKQLEAEATAEDLRTRDILERGDRAGEQASFRFIGERGAANLDKAEEATTRLDNLGVAREMESTGKDAKSIKMATGWERGADGKWRYETEDGVFDVTGELHPERRSLSAEERAELDGAFHELMEAFEKGSLAISEDKIGESSMADIYVAGGMERSRAERLAALEDKEDAVKHTPKYLDDYLEQEELFAAYPELRDIKLVEGDSSLALFGALGSYNPQTKTITLNYLSHDTLLHEVQHIIQHIEGFAVGGSKGTISAAFRNNRHVRNEVDGLLNSLGYNEWLKNATPAELSGEKVDGRNFNAGYAFSHSLPPSLGNALRDKLDEANGVIKHNNRLSGGERGLTPQEQYNRLSGEVEARNAQRRMNMSADERRHSLASETEDVAREDQIFIYDALESANSEIEKQKPFHEMIDDLYGNKDADKSKYARTYFHVADTPDFMSGIGLNGAEFTMPFKAISSHIGKDSDHYLDADIWHNLPEALHNPFLVTKYGKDGRFRIYTTLMHNGKYVAVGVDVKRINQGRNKPIIEINSIKTVFAKTGKIGENETVVCYDERITPEQEALLGGRNFRQYPTIQELSEHKVTDNSANEQGEAGISFRRANRSQVGFVSNAMKAVEGIKQEKATPQQWLAMIQKQGGLKAGEDKWLGLSDWLKGSEAKTLTKDEVLDFIGENMIRIEEVKYADNSLGFQNIYGKAYYTSDDEYTGVPVIKVGEVSEAARLFNKRHPDMQMHDDPARITEEEYGILESFGYELYRDQGKDIHPVRLDYTTEGLYNKREIALTVPTVESWRSNDDIHFGDAGDGRAVAWIRFGETWAYVKEYADFYDYSRQLVEKYFPGRESHTLSASDLSVMTEEEVAEYNRFKAIKESVPMKDSRERVLVIDEIQSKRHQEGREKGYLDVKEYRRKERELNDSLDEIIEQRVQLIQRLNSKYPNGYHKTEEGVDEHGMMYKKLVVDERRVTEEEYALYNKLSADIVDLHEQIRSHTRNIQTYSVPSAPFEKNWHELAMKRMLRLAAEEGFDKVAWTKGAQQAKRYGMGNAVDSIESVRTGSGRYRLMGIKAGKMVFDQYSEKDELPELVGMELAAKITESEEEEQTFEGADLQIGGQGMKGFYDKMLPSFVQKYTKKWGAKVGEVNLPRLEESAQKMWAVDVTEQMRDEVDEQVMFSKHSVKSIDARNYGMTETEANRAIDDATAIVTGKSRSEARDIRLQREAARKARAKELYDAVLSGDFNDVTLRMIDNYISDVTPRNPYGNRISQRVPQAVERTVYGDKRTGAVDLLFGRISESAVAASERTSKAGRRAVEEKKKELLKGWAIATGNWHTDLSAFVADETPFDNGKDSDVFYSQEDGYVIKASKGKPIEKGFPVDLDNIPLFNYYFPNTEYEILGYGEIEGAFVRILRQPLVPFADAASVSVDDRVAHMASMGFRPLNKAKTAFTNDDFVVADLQKANIVRDDEGDIRIIDADMKLHTTDVGGNYSYPDVEEDVSFRVFGGNSGYVGYSKSKRAVAAEERGLRNASQMNAEFAKEVNSIIEERTGKPSKLTLKAIKAALPDIKADEWHHTSKFGNKTNYYSAEGVASHFAKDPAEEARESAAREDAKLRDAYAAAVRERIPTMKVETALGERDAFITSEGYAVEVPNNVIYNPGSARLYAIGELMGAAPYVVDSTNDWVFSNRDAYDDAVREYVRAVEKAMAEVDADEEVSFKRVTDRRKVAELEAIAKEEAAIIETAKKNGTYLKAPNGEPTKLTPKQWVQVRTKAFKKWFGDWEKAARIEKLRASGDAVITGEEIAPSDDLKEYKKNALEYGKTLRGEYVNADTGQTISIGKSGVKEVLNHDYKNAEQLQSIAAIPLIIENAIYIDSAENEDVSKNKDVSHYHYYICGLKIGDVDYTVRAVVAEQSNGERYYDHKLTQIEKGTLLDSLSGITTPGFNQETSPVSMGKDTKLLSLLQTNASKVVDENGEPMVATHGTPEFFNTFDVGTQGAHDAGWLGTGFYFYTKNREYSNAYVRGGGRVMDVFLNIRNPYYATSYEMERLAEADSRDVSEEFTQELLDEGYDGVYYDGDLNGETVAFHPNQIKSAEENVGLFSEEDEDIRFRSKHEEAREDWATRTANIQAAVDHYERMTASTGKKWFVTALAKTLSLNAGTRRAARNDLAEAYFDYTRSLEQLIKGLEKAYGKKVKGFENVWWAMNRKSSMDAREMDRVRFKYVDPLSDALGNLLRHAKELRGEKMTDTDVETYLMALHGLERNLHMAKRYAREAMIKEVTDGLALKEREAAINNVDATIAAREANGEEWWSEYRKDYSGFTEMFGVSIIAA